MNLALSKNKINIEKGYKQSTLGLIPIDWQIRTVVEAFNICNNLRFPISEEERKKMKGCYPYYGPTKIQDYINEYRIDGRYALIGEDGDHFLKWKTHPMTLLVEGKFNVNNHAHVIQGVDNMTEWFFYYFNHRELTPYLTRQGAGRYKLTKDALSKVPCLLPCFSEQKAIVNVLSVWDDAIQTTESLIIQKKLRNKWLLQQLLTGKKRLQGFSGKWEIMIASHFLELRDEQSTNDGIIPLFSLTIENGVTEKSDRYEREFLVKDKAIKKYKIAYPNDIVYNPANLKWGAIAKHNRNFPVLLSPIYETLKVKGNFNADFISYLLSSPRQISFYASIVEGTLIERMAVKLDAFLSIKYPIPSVTEQDAIAKVLQTGEDEIKALQKMLTQLKTQKKGLMQQLLTGKKRLNI